MNEKWQWDSDSNAISGPEQLSKDKREEIKRLMEETAMAKMNLSINDIKKKVRRKLNADVAQKRLYIKHRMIQVLVAALIMALLGAATVFAMTHVDILKDFFSDDTSTLCHLNTMK